MVKLHYSNFTVKLFAFDFWTMCDLSTQFYDEQMKTFKTWKTDIENLK